MQQIAQMVGDCYDKYECWYGASVSVMHACRSKFNRHDCLLRHGIWSDAIVTDMVDGLV